MVNNFIKVIIKKNFLKIIFIYLFIYLFYSECLCKYNMFL